MKLIKDVSDQDIEKLFDQNDNKEFVTETNDSDTSNESFIPKELDATDDSKKTINRPESYDKQEIRTKKLELKQQKEALKNASETELLKTTGNVTTKVFNEIAKVRQQAQLEEFVSKQRKVPRISETAKYRLYGNEPQCTFHVYQIQSMLEGKRMQATCKFCSHEKIFTEEEWKMYELENHQYM